MEDYFEHEVKKIERELIRLKTSAKKSAGIVPTIAKTINLNIPLSLDASRTSCSGNITYKISIDSVALIMPTLDWYYGNVIDNDHFPYTTRRASIVSGRLSNGDYIVRVQARGTYQDAIDIAGGASISVQVNLTVRSSDIFTMEALS